MRGNKGEAEESEITEFGPDDDPEATQGMKLHKACICHSHSYQTLRTICDGSAPCVFVFTFLGHCQYQGK